MLSIILTILYIADVRCNKISPDMAEAAAFHMMKQLIDRRLLLLGNGARSLWLCDVLIHDRGLGRYQQQDPALRLNTPDLDLDVDLLILSTLRRS